MLNSLLDKFNKKYPGLGRASVKNLLVLMLCILEKETVNLNKAKRAVPSVLANHDSTMNAHYKRLLRVFEPDHRGEIDQLQLSVCFILRWVLAHHAEGGKVWLMDATSWEFGSRKIQVLVLSVLFQGVAIPIMWLDLGKKGHSCFAERKALLRMAGKFYDLKGKVLVGDREYIGREWFGYIRSLGMDFIFRLPYGDYRSEINESSGKSYSHLEKLAQRGKRKVAKSALIAGVRGTVVMFRNEGAQDANDRLVILFSTLTKVSKIAQWYRQRWAIEYCFKHLKTNGFDLEELGFKDRRKIRLLLAVVIAAYVLAIREGLKSFKSIPRKTYASGKQYLAQSVFTKGLDNLTRYTANFVLFLELCLSYLDSFQKPKNKTQNSP
jgi:Transposase DDE domain